MRFSGLGGFARSLLFILAAPGLCTTMPALATDKIPIEIFAQLPRVRQVQLSPDGNWLAYTSPLGGRMNLVIAPLDQSRKPEAIPPVADVDINWFHWANNERLLVSYRYTNDLGSAFIRTALFSVHVKEPGYIDMAREPKKSERPYYLGTRTQIRDNVMDYLPDDPDHFLLSIDGDWDGRAEVRKVDINTGAFAEQTKGYDDIHTWMSDQNHNFRYGWGRSQKGPRVLFIDPDTNRHHELQDKPWYEDDTVSPIGFTADPHIMYALEAVDGDRRRLITFDPLKGERVSVVFEHPDVDVNGLAMHPETDLPAGAYFTDDLTDIHYFDPELAAIQKQLNEWLPGGTNQIESMNGAKQLYVVRHTEATADLFYLLDLKNGGAKILGNAVPLKPEQQGPTKRLDLKARDGGRIPTYLTVPPGYAGGALPMVVLPHGGPSSRDTLDYNYLTQFLASRGYAVLKPNFRGSGGFGLKFRVAGENQWGGLMQDDVTDATRWAIDQGIADPAHICIAGGSYGGYAALMGAIKEQGLYRCAVSLNGVANLVDLVDRQDNLFLDRESRKLVGLEGHNREEVSPYHQAKLINVPVLIVHAKDDPVVPFEQGQSLYKRLKQLKKPVKMVTIESGDHFLDTEAARIEFLKPLEAFLKEQLGS